MRKQTITKIVACACVAAMAVSFGACKKADKKTTTTTAPTTTVADPNATTEATTTAAGGATTAGAPGATSNKPTDTASAVKFYNDAVAKMGGVKATVSRTLVDGTIKILGIPTPLDTLAPGAKDAFALTDADLAGATLVALDATSVASSSVAEAGDNYVITFNLADANLNSTSAPGANGFMYFLDVNTLVETIVSIGKSIAGDGFVLGVNAPDVTINVNGGKFEVTINKTTGAMSTASLSFTEDVKAPITKPVSASANVQGKGTVTYTVS